MSPYSYLIFRQTKIFFNLDVVLFHCRAHIVQASIADGVLSGNTDPKKNIELLQDAIASITLLGSIITSIPLSRYQLIMATNL